MQTVPRLGRAGQERTCTADMTRRNVDSISTDLYQQPGHLIRRAHQISVSVFLETVGGALTPIQYAMLRALQEEPGIDQVTLARRVALDNSTAANTAARLEAKGWISREILPRRQRRLVLTPEGESLMQRLLPAIRELNRVLLKRLEAAERRELIRLLAKFVDLSNDLSRAPLRRTGRRGLAVAD